MAAPAIPKLSELIPNLQTITGPPLLCIILNSGLFGVLSTQVYIYYQAFPKDKKLLKCLVYGVYLLETAQTIFLTQTAWRMFAHGFGDISGINAIGTSWLSVCVINGIVAFLVQSFYAYRLSVISQSRILTGLIMVLAVTSLAGSIGTGIDSGSVKLFTEFISHRKKSYTIVGIWEGAASLCDATIAILMTYYLKRFIHQGGARQTQQVVSRIIRMTIETGTLTATVSIVSLALFYIPQLQGFYEVPLASLAKLYSTTLLVVLNSRVKMGIISESTTWRDVEVTPMSFKRGTGPPVLTRIDVSQAMNASIVSTGPMEFSPGDENKTAATDDH
ncbi:hypothetical protein HYPSUDRAFT_220158 [Hypholoma sublateritium FD-334 SS-4]|uniref:DUF6534 domain-containing protein n=1 Tax=Hypholoma sublateritium (strain FD-334 SS-4) TaxID=945553 RepID=A0A0D2LWJ1_HYPSF|nr:hypothetical protein HYPSUDRAFT_220158 [Hypholoma sublateritium FD-334 SS-4]